MGDKTIDYSLVDTNLDVYVIRIKERDKHKFQLDHHLVYRTISALKRNNQAPVGKRMPARKGEPAGSSNVAPAKSATSTKCVKWSSSEVVDLLSICAQKRLLLRCAQTPLSVWQTISCFVSKDCTAEHCREKFRNLKATYTKVKSGKAGKRKLWEHTRQMAYILDDPVAANDASTIPVDPVDQVNDPVRQAMEPVDQVNDLVEQEMDAGDQAGVSVSVAPTILFDEHGNISINGASVSGVRHLSAAESGHDQDQNNNCSKNLVPDIIVIDSDSEDFGECQNIQVTKIKVEADIIGNEFMDDESGNETAALSLHASQCLWSPNLTEVGASKGNDCSNSQSLRNPVNESVDDASGNETAALSLHASRRLWSPNLTEVGASKRNDCSNSKSLRNPGGYSFNVTGALNDTRFLSFMESGDLTFISSPHATPVINEQSHTNPAESSQEQSEDNSRGFITLTPAECHNLGVEVLPEDHHVQVLRPQVQLLDQNNNCSKNLVPDIIVIDSDSEDFGECQNIQVTKIKVEADIIDEDQPESGSVPPDDTVNANDLTVGQTTFFGQIGSASTPNFRNREGAEVRMTPPKKKTSTFVFRSPTNNTPKRKIPAIRLMWEGHITDAFVQACVSRKADIQKADVPLKVWKDIKEEMDKTGHMDTWQCYRAKFQQMNDFFSNSLLSKRGMVHGIVWPYYNQFCHIHDVPSDFVPCQENVETSAILTPSKRKRIWTNAAEKLLISLYAERKEKFDGSKSVVRHSTLYNQIAGVMQVHNINVSSKQCKAHMNDIIREFREAYDASRKTGAGAPTYVHFEAMLQIFQGSATLITPVATSVGRGLAYSVNGVSTDTSSQSGTRTRQSTSSSSSTPSTSKGRQSKGVFKSLNQEFMERQLQLKEAENEQFRLMREGFEKKSAERGDMIKDLVKLAAWDIQMRMGQGGNMPFDLNALKSLQM